MCVHLIRPTVRAPQCMQFPERLPHSVISDPSPPLCLLTLLTGLNSSLGSKRQCCPLFTPWRSRDLPFGRQGTQGMGIFPWVSGCYGEGDWILCQPEEGLASARGGAPWISGKLAPCRGYWSETMKQCWAGLLNYAYLLLGLNPNFM